MIQDNTWTPIDQFLERDQDGRKILVSGLSEYEPFSRWYSFAFFDPLNRAWFSEDEAFDLYPPTHFMFVSTP